MAFGIGAKIRAEKRAFKEEEARALASSRMAEIERQGEFALRAIEKPEDTSSGLSTARPISEVPYLPESRERGRLGDIMRASPKELRDIYERMPIEERPVHIIRGERQSYLSPGTGQEYSDLRTAMTGFRQRPAAELRSALESKADFTPKQLADVRSKAFDQLQTEWGRMNIKGLWTHPLEKDKEGNFRPLTAGEITKKKREMYDELVGRYTGSSGKETRIPETKDRGWLTTASADPDQYYGGLPRISPPSLSGLPSVDSTTRTSLMSSAREFTPAGTPRVSPPLKSLRQMFGEEKRAVVPLIESFKERWKKRKKYPATSFGGLGR